jgi:hypothetical protein
MNEELDPLLEDDIEKEYQEAGQIIDQDILVILAGRELNPKIPCKEI